MSSDTTVGNSEPDIHYISSSMSPVIEKPEVLDQQDQLDRQEARRVKRIVYKNLFIVGLSWVFLFTAYQSIANLQSSLNSVNGLGTASLSTIYVSLILSCIFVPTLMIKKLTVKWTIFISQLCYILFIAANIYPQYYTLIPSAIIVGCNSDFPSLSYIY